MPRYYGRRKYLSIHVVMNALLCLSGPVRGGYAVTTFIIEFINIGNYGGKKCGRKIFSLQDLSLYKTGKSVTTSQ